jgi:hypothetical protein
VGRGNQCAVNGRKELSNNHVEHELLVLLPKHQMRLPVARSLNEAGSTFRPKKFDSVDFEELSAPLLLRSGNGRSTTMLSSLSPKKHSVQRKNSCLSEAPATTHN